MKKISFFLLCSLISVWTYAQEAKYVFFFIGDGMGVNQVQGTELYLGELDGKIGLTPLDFTEFPYATTSSTYSATNGVTDSAAGGTALATGTKTKNGTIGMEQDQQTPIASIAMRAKEKGCRVGIATSVSIDHATPAAFYAHNPNRKNYYQIGKDLFTAGFDFYAGSDFLDPDNHGQGESLYTLASQYGYTLARGYEDFMAKNEQADKLILLQTEKASATYRDAIPYAIDRREGDLCLSDITSAAIRFLSKDLSKGFFLMVEGGKIDWACHSNDAATAFREVVDLNESIRQALQFYENHPDETLIVISADHETGGLVLGTGAYALNLQALQYQRVSETAFTSILNSLRRQTGNRVTWEQARQALADNFGFWNELKLTEQQAKRLEEVYCRTFTGSDVEMEKSEYAQDEPLAAEAVRIINEIAMVGWVSGGHSAGYVPVFAIGAGADHFQGRMDNVEIPARIAEIAHYQ
ncbi:alkaline phosphatase [Bacteroides gallinaceum]|uniref:Alkaline phosphatase n=1 Tax=Bacteroides gallinaceum TaxID=1462571 RepID=A0ABT7XAU9_9BACE|nr:MULTISPECIES: alkaline phosphatase [Bacteroides]CCZ69172.1 alkaline phosphatase [Bacteroides sp. CAG:702]HJD09622.1 alkaline phosphatase [Candidatus Phocaeicola caecigallinarum]MBM6720963.1 alkaline phosphatase [Bacteroides gallinaceum]MBM6945755.1 alkaline phosphatase [Bacteroides gallinaceum]MDN0051212.1 alkaline phosphatase [Bacteroides gallinaceum]